MVRLNLGSGGDKREGFVNLDYSSGADFKCDLGSGIPVNVALPNSVDYIYTSHFLEHIFDDQVEVLLRSCFEVLKPGGTIRFCLPDFKKLAEAYLKNDISFFSLLPVGKPDNPISYLEYCAYQYVGRNNEHKALYDAHKLIMMLRAVGFVGIQEKSPDPIIDIADEVRTRYSFYIEAHKKSSYPQYMGGSTVLFAITVHDRLLELRLQETLIRNEYGKTVGIHVFCNCSAAEVNRYKGMLEDGFHWIENNGHAQGSIDHPNMAVKVSDAYDYVVLLAAKTIWSDYSLISNIISEMKRSGKQVAVFDDGGSGHFKDMSKYAFFCDFMVFSSELYKKVFPIGLSADDFPETNITNKVLDLVGGKQNVYYIPCIPPEDAVQKFLFDNILGTSHCALSYREMPRKIEMLTSKNIRYREIYERLLRDS